MGAYRLLYVCIMHVTQEDCITLIAQGEDVMQEKIYQVRAIAHIHTDFPTKFGVPRQSGLAPSLQAKITFEKEFAQPEAVRGLAGYSYLWLLWRFSESPEGHWTATVRPPRLGGNVRMGVFATRSPFRPNGIGLSSVRLLRVETDTPEGPVLYVAGADLMDGTPILDIKPYLAYVDSHPEAEDGFAGQAPDRNIRVVFPPELLHRVPEEKREALLEVLAENPVPQYQKEPSRVYGFGFAGQEIKFRTDGETLTVVGVFDA